MFTDFQVSKFLLSHTYSEGLLKYVGLYVDYLMMSVDSGIWYQLTCVVTAFHFQFMLKNFIPVSGCTAEIGFYHCC
jgi:hypothetical protein